MKCRIQIYKKYWKFITLVSVQAFKLETIDVRFAELPASALSLTSKQNALYRSALDRLSKCVWHFGSFYWFLRK